MNKALQFFYQLLNMFADATTTDLDEEGATSELKLRKRRTRLDLYSTNYFIV